MKKKSGLIIFVGALGMMATLTAGDMANLTGWNDAFSPLFMAKVIGHFGTVTAAYVGGQLTERHLE